MYLEYSLPLFCIPEIISVINQGFELAFTLTFVIGATESIALMILFIKSEYEAFIQAYFKQPWKRFFPIFLWNFLFFWCVSDPTSIWLCLWDFGYDFCAPNVRSRSDKPKSITPDELPLWEEFVSTRSISVAILTVVQVLMWSFVLKNAKSKIQHIFWQRRHLFKLFLQFYC